MAKEKADESGAVRVEFWPGYDYPWRAFGQTADCEVMLRFASLKDMLQFARGLSRQASDWANAMRDVFERGPAG